MRNSKAEAETLRQLGAAYWNLSEYQQARTYLHKALYIFQQLYDHSGEARVLVDLGLLYGFRWSMYENPVYDHQRAIYHLQQALSLLQSSSHSSEDRLYQQAR